MREILQGYVQHLYRELKKQLWMRTFSFPAVISQADSTSLHAPRLKNVIPKKSYVCLQDTCRRSFSTVMSTGECQTEANLTTVSLPQLSQPLHACSLTVSLLDLINIAILLSVCSEIVMIAVWRIWYLMNLKSPYWYCSLVSSLICLISYCIAGRTSVLVIRGNYKIKW